MQRRFFLKSIFGAAAALSATSMISAGEALAKPLAQTPVADPAHAMSTAPAEDLPAADAKESYWVVRRRFYRRRVFFRPRYRRRFYYRPRYRRRVFFRRRFWW